MPVKSEAGPGKLLRQAADHVCRFFGTGAAGRVAHHDAAHTLVDALLGKLTEIVQAARMKIWFASNSVFTTAAVRIHCVLKVDDDLEAVVLQALDCLLCHAEILLRGGLERFRYI